ncbi:hypothetical protein M430DRAFT_183137 [Amorphotheca resinae ATCC 22711]|jgi:hypothetical protein|uniref:Transmembrane protein n=1 Tax=Amorphotheca resinae ATCC 22711 TaxID=857342 RepID=A0A2T3ARZ8_AMORE|nr:hypothetical protein M430DRAFT_183137 [Amorphotheca resinae ATCC 22711]PSS09123.1 hypothetical protein M430DRAFT_183137 [Amorphotheca resinae ATCC 22711]
MSFSPSTKQASTATRFPIAPSQKALRGRQHGYDDGFYQRRGACFSLLMMPLLLLSSLPPFFWGLFFWAFFSWFFPCSFYRALDLCPFVPLPLARNDDPKTLRLSHLPESPSIPPPPTPFAEAESPETTQLLPLVLFLGLPHLSTSASASASASVLHPSLPFPSDQDSALRCHCRLPTSHQLLLLPTCNLQLNLLGALANTGFLRSQTLVRTPKSLSPLLRRSRSR